MKRAKIDYKLVNKAEIARRLGISQAYVHLLLSGQRAGKKSDYWLKKIAEIANDRAA
jgi:transcriptional regulator with XRE-family HTH domain